MFAASPAVVDALREIIPQLSDADTLEERLATDLAVKRPDLTGILLDVSAAALQTDVPLPRPLVAAITRAACARLAEKHPGASIEVRVPPFSACQVGFGTGPRHTRGTPPNVVETDAETFRRLLAGTITLADAQMRISGSHAHEVSQAFPLTAR